jgi:hypothetical protein
VLITLPGISAMPVVATCLEADGRHGAGVIVDGIINMVNILYCMFDIGSFGVTIAHGLSKYGYSIYSIYLRQQQMPLQYTEQVRLPVVRSYPSPKNSFAR